MAEDPQKYFVEWAKIITSRVDRLGRRISALSKKIQRHGAILAIGVVASVSVAVYNYADFLWDKILPKIGLRESVHYQFSLRESVFFSKGFDYQTNITTFNFHVNIYNTGQYIGGGGRLLIAKRSGSGTKLITVSGPQRSVDNMSLSIDFAPTPDMVRLSDLPDEILVCAWQTDGKKRVIPLLSRLAPEYANVAEVKRVWPQGKVAYAPYTAIPTDADANDPLTREGLCPQIAKSIDDGKAPDCVPFSDVLNRDCKA